MTIHRSTVDYVQTGSDTGYDGAGHFRHGRRTRSKFHVNQYVYYITNEMIYNEEKAIRLMVSCIDYDIRYQSFVYEAVPTESVDVGVGKQAYRENDLLAETAFIKKIKKVHAQMRAEEQKKMDSKHNVLNGGMTYALYRYGRKRRCKKS